MNIRKRLKNLKSLFWSKKVPPLPWHCKPGKSIPKSALLEAMRSSLAQLPVSNSDVQMRGKIELGTSGSFKIVRTPASYIISRSGQGKWAKKFFFRISANYSENVVTKIVTKINTATIFHFRFCHSISLKTHELGPL